MRRRTPRPNRRNVRRGGSRRGGARRGASRTYTMSRGGYRL